MYIQTIQQPNKLITTTVDLTTKPFLLWYLTSMNLGKGLRGHATMWVSMYTSEGLTPSKSFKHPKDRDNKLEKSGII